MATTKATELGQLGGKLTVHNENITLDGNVHGQYAGFDSDFTNALSSSISVTGDIAVSGTVDGRDVATDGTKLDGVETAATADQTKADIEGLGIDVPATNLTGTIPAARLSTATTQAESDDSTKIATTAYVVDKITTLIGGAPSTLNDLNELAAAINDDANYNSTLTTALATKLPLAGGTMTGNINFGDNDKVIFGAGSDLQIHHHSPSGNTYISESGSGSLVIAADELIIQNSAHTEYKAIFTTDGAVTLYHDHSLKLATTATGIDVTGTVTSDGLTTDSISNASGNLNISSTQSIALKFDSNSDQTNREFNILHDNNTKVFTADEYGDIKFYEDTGTTAKFFWDASAERLGLGTSSPDMDLHVLGGEVLFEGTGNSKLQIKAGNTSGSFIEFADAQDGNVGRIFYDHSDNHMQFTVNAAERMRIDSSGRLLLGTSTSFADVNSDDLQISGSSDTGMMIKSGTSSYGSIYFGDATSGGARNAGIVRYKHGDDNMQFWTAEGERVRIDSNGNLLVGKTATGIGTVGAELKPTGELLATVNNDACAFLNRKSSDGNIAVFRKDNTTVGSIGNNTDFYIASQDGCGLRFTNNQVLPCSESGATQTTSRDLGSSGARFRDFYLSGSIANPSGNLLLDASGDIYLDADGGDIFLDDGPTRFGKLSNDSSSLQIKSEVSNKDIIFKGNDNGTAITALTLDMSSSGNAIFNNEVFLGDTKALTMGASSDFQIYHDAGGFNQIIAKNDHPIQIKTASENMIKAIPNGAVELYHNNSLKFNTTSSGVAITGDLTISGQLSNVNLTGTGAHLPGHYFQNTYDGTNIYWHVGPGTTSTTNKQLNIRIFKSDNTTATSTWSPSGLSVSGFVTASGNVTAYSDISLKDNITSIPNALDKVLQIRGVTYNRNDVEDNPRHTGVIAQEVEKVLPEVISESEDGIKSVAYGNMVGLLVEAIKELKAEIEELKGK